MTSITQEAAVLLGMVQQEKRKLQAELRALGVSRPGDSVTTEPQMQALGRNVVLSKLGDDLHHFIQGWVAEGGS